MTNQTKDDLAYAYRLLGHLAMDDHTYTHLSARHGGGAGPSHGTSYYIYPFGLRFEEVTPDTLIRVDLHHQILEGEEYQFNKTGFTIHGSIYQQRPDVHAIFHLHTPATVAVSAMEEGLLPISQWALHFYDHVAYHPYDSLVLDGQSQGNKLVRDLGNHPVLFLRNHGIITCGRTIHEAMFYCYHLELACKTQIMALGTGRPLVMPSPETCQKTNKDLLAFEEDLGLRDWLAWKRYVDRMDGKR